MNQATYSRGITAKEGAQILGCSESTFWKYAKDDPAFPSKRKLSTRISRWIDSEIIAYRDSKTQQKEPA